MKILAIQETDWIKRGPHHSHHLLERLTKLGHHIRVIDFDIDWRNTKKKRKIISKRKIIQAKPKTIQGVNISIFRPSFIKLKGIDFISIGISQFFELLRQVKEFKPDIIISFGIISGFSSLITCRLYRIPFCEFWLDVLHELIPIFLLKPIGLAVEKFVVKRCDLYIAVNTRLLEYGRGFNPIQSTMIRAGVDLKLFFYNEENRSKTRTQLRVREDECLLFFMGFLYKFSGLPKVIERIYKDSQYLKKF